MKPSKELQGQLDRLKNTGAFTVSIILKHELAKLVKEYGYNELLNLDCGTCVRQAMHNVNSYLNQLNAKPVLSFKGVKNVTEMNYQELRKAVKAKGIKTGANPTKSELIKLLQ